MKVEILTKLETDIKYIEVSAGVRHWGDTTVNGIEDEDGTLIPCKVNDNWCPTINIDSGQITNWTKGIKADVHYKICDDGYYNFLNNVGEVMITLEQEYVPSILSPKEPNYGDYIIMDIDENGFIDGWNPNDLKDVIDKYNETFKDNL